MRATKFCPRCKTTKSVDEFWRRRRNKPQLMAYCIACTRAARREYAQRPEVRARERERARRNRAAIVADPERLERSRAYDREAKRLLRKAARKDARLAARLAEARRRWWQGVKADPERHAAYLEDQRIDYVLRLERQGRRPGPQHGDVTETSANRGKGGFGLQLEPAPLIEWIAGRSPAEVARGDETLARGLFRVLSGESKTVSIHLVDRLCVVHGYLLLHDIYDPNEYPEAFAA